jgi:hypothetical protein
MDLQKTAEPASMSSEAAPLGRSASRSTTASTYLKNTRKLSGVEGNPLETGKKRARRSDGRNSLRMKR